MSSITITLPEWIGEVARSGERFVSIEDRMRLTVSLARENVQRRSGGPFGAVVFERDTGVLVAAAVNAVIRNNCSLAHAEAVALMLAQNHFGTFNLGDSELPPLELVASSQPCIQCFGAIWWSGVPRVVTGASVHDTFAVAGFDEGPVPTNWAELLRSREPLRRNVEVIEGVLAEECRAVLRLYRDMEGVVY